MKQIVLWRTIRCKLKIKEGLSYLKTPLRTLLFFIYRTLQRLLIGESISKSMLLSFKIRLPMRLSASVNACLFLIMPIGKRGFAWLK